MSEHSKSAPNLDSSVRVRFAPSPTGFLHIGGARAALFNWLYARAKGGKFLLRIEDTDTERSEARFTDDILASLDWLGLHWDEPPVHQTQRVDRYKQLIEKLIAEGKAYYCNCTAEELEKERERVTALKKPYRYPRTCRPREGKAPKPKLDTSVVRVLIPAGDIEFTDLIRGPIRFSSHDVDDWVAFRANGMPTYNFSVVVDDADQKITHVLRGDDHINNTPKQILLYHALGFPVPRFGHMPMILGPDKAKLSKRHGAASTLEYRAMGYLPDALVNFLARLGWSHGDQEIFTREELKKYFDLDHVGKSSAVFAVDKLNWINGHFLAIMPAEDLWKYAKAHFGDSLARLDTRDEATAIAAVREVQGKTKTVIDLVDQLDCLFGQDPAFEAIPAERLSDLKSVVPVVAQELHGSDFTLPDLERRVKGVVAQLGVKMGVVGQSVRFAVTGGRVSPDLFAMLHLQGKDRVLRRMGSLLEKL